MKSIVAVLASRWLLSFVGTSLLAGLVWYFGPLVPPLDESTPRLAAVGGMLLVWFALNLVLDLGRLRRDAALAAGVTTGAAAVAEEAAALSQKLATALRLLRKKRGGKGYLYEQPWYAIIGPPGAGKTTALLNAGLNFPLAAEMGQGAVAGVGGTRLCDWWFTDDAVLIDTAGRYTTQDSDTTVDRAGWDAFLDLLKRTRTQQPLNGVIVAIALSDIALASPADRRANAQAVRRRVRELETRLGVRMPVYALFTKADLIAGFTEFFDDLDREARNQVWGFTLPPGAADPAAAFAPEFRALVERLNARLFQRLQAERSPDRRSLIAGFPAQVASLEQPLANFLQEAFSPAGNEAAPMLRGCYLTSGTQEGTPIDRLTGALARAFGLDQRRAPSLRPEQGRSYFLGRLLRDVIFNEAMLVSARPGARRRRLVARMAGFAVLLVAVLAAGGMLWRNQVANQRQIDDVVAALDSYERAAGAMPLDPVADGDLPRLAPVLDQARMLPLGYEHGTNTETAGMAARLPEALGLTQDAKLAAATREVYRHALDYALLPRLIWRLEAQMRGNLSRPDYLYEATRVYLMLGGGGPLDRELVHVWMNLDWQAAYPAADMVPVRESLLRHLDALISEPLPSVALDGDLVAAARATFGKVPLVQRVYSRLRPSAAAQRMAPWRPLDALGAAGATLFVRASGKPLDEGIPGFYTVEGFHKALLPALATAEKSVAAESWVLGKRAEFDLNGPQMRTLERDVITQYEGEYARAWDAILADLNVVQLRSVPQAAQDLFILASPDSPLRALVLSIARELTLSVPPGGSVAKPTAPVAVASVEESRLQSLMGVAQAAEPAALPPGHEIDERYKAFRDLAGNGPGAPIDLVVKSLTDMQQQFAKMAAAPPGSTSLVTGDDPALPLRAEAARQPQPVQRWLAGLATDGSALRGGGAKQQTVSAFNAAGGPGPVCAAAINGHYPFTTSSAADMPMDDFTKLFAPGGLLDGFFNTQLRPYVAIAGATWRPQPVNNVPAPVSAADLTQFQRAQAIRDLFFAGGGTKPGLRFDITPVNADSTTKQVTLDLDGTVIGYAHGPPRATQVTWPGPNGTKTVRLSFDPPPTANPAGLQEVGPWALFRLFGHGQVQPAPAADSFTVTFQFGDRQAVFEIHGTAAGNPVAPAAFRDFHCPAVQ